MENRLKLLISEDCGEFTRDTCDMFRHYGMDVSFGPKDGFRIMEIIEATNPDVVITEVFMPRSDAIGLITSIRKNPSIPNPIFITLSNFASPSLEREVMSAGASYFILKPFSASDLAERILQLYKHKNDPDKNQGQDIPDSPVQNLDPVQSLEIKVTEILHQIGVPAHIKGYHYLRSSIIMSINNPDIINAVTKQLYPSVAENFSTTSSRVERAIRHAIEVAWDRGDVDILNSYFGYTIHNGRGKPTNSEFIAMISDKLRLQFKSAS